MEPIGRNISEELGRFGAAPGLAPIADVWQGAVGADIARNAWPARLARDGTLVVHTSSSAWAFELAQLEPRIRELLGAAAPRKLRFVVGLLPEAATPEPECSKVGTVEPSTRARVAADELTASIEDEKLRKIVAKAAALSLSGVASDRPLW